MRTLLDLSLIVVFSALTWTGSMGQYDSCVIDDYQSVLIDPTVTDRLDPYAYLALPGICLHRGDVAYLLLSRTKPDVEGELSVDFPDTKGRPITNQFNMVPFCLAFITGAVEGSAVLMRGDYGEPLLTIGPQITLSINTSTVSFDAGYSNYYGLRRLQICVNGTNAIYYIDCEEVAVKPFAMPPSMGIGSLSVLGEVNETTFEFEKIFSGWVQQLFSIQCSDPLADLSVLSSVQCRSVPAGSSKDCYKPVQSDLDKVLAQTVFELAPTPVEIYSFCQILVWRNSPNISVEDLLGTDVRLFNPALNKEVIRHVTGYEPFYILEEDDVCFMQGDSTAEIRLMLSSSDFVSVGPFSEPVLIECPPPERPSVHFELKGQVYKNGSRVNITEIGEGENALLCKTNKRDCCRRPKTGEFLYPSGISVPAKKRLRHGFYRKRSNQTVRLNRRVSENVAGPTGYYCCQVPDAGDVEQNICIELV